MENSTLCSLYASFGTCNHIADSPRIINPLIGNKSLPNKSNALTQFVSIWRETVTLGKRPPSPLKSGAPQGKTSWRLLKTSANYLLKAYVRIGCVFERAVPCDIARLFIHRVHEHTPPQPSPNLNIYHVNVAMRREGKLRCNSYRFSESFFSVNLRVFDDEWLLVIVSF